MTNKALIAYLLPARLHLEKKTTIFYRRYVVFKDNKVVNNTSVPSAGQKIFTKIFDSLFEVAGVNSGVSSDYSK